ncbi:MAG: hypothetical protein WC554_17740 [Clostridia bacterium]|jgi:hypothetical protein
MKPDEEEFKKLKWLLERLHRSEEYCRPYFDRAKRHYQLYRFSTAVADADWPYVNRVRSRDILAFVEDTTAILIQTLFATQPFISIIPRETGNSFVQQLGIDLTEVARQVEHLLDYQLSHEDTDFLEEIIDFFKSGGIQGNSYIGVYPNFEGGEYTLPLLKTTGFWDVLPIPGSKRISKALGVFVREFVTMDDLRKMEQFGVYKNIDKVDQKGSGDTDNWHKSLLEDVGMSGYTTSEDIEVIHYFAGGHVITFANRKNILRDSTIPVTDQMGQQIYEEPFPYSNPLVHFKHTPIPDEFFAMGIPEILEVLQEDKNLIRSARRDNIDLVINKIIQTKDGSDLNYDLLRYFPGAIWPDTMGKVEVMEMTDVTQSSYAEEKGIQADMENALSLFGYARGMTPAHTEQPTTVMKLQQASMNRQDINVKMAEITVLQEIARKIVMLNRKYMKQETYEAIIGEPDAGFYRLPIQYINRMFIMKPVGSSVTHIKEVRQQQIMGAINLAMPYIQNPQLGQINIEPFTVNSLELLREGFDSSDVKTINRILIPTPKEQPQQDPLMQMALQGIMSDPNMIEGLMTPPEQPQQKPAQAKPKPQGGK